MKFALMQTEEWTIGFASKEYKGRVVDIDISTFRIWKKAIDEYKAVQEQMAGYFNAAEVPSEMSTNVPSVKPDSGPPIPLNETPPSMRQMQVKSESTESNEETVAFASMGNLKFSDPNVTVSANEPKQPVGMSIQPAPSQPDAGLRQEGNPVQAKRRGRPPKKAQEDKVGIA